MAERDYVAAAHKYAREVVDGKIPACKWVILACQRQLKDLERAKTGELPYIFDKQRAWRVCFFVEQLPHVKGRWGSATLALEPWQIFILCTFFGWVDAQGLRRYRTSYTEIPRKNAKSTLTSGVGLYLLAADGEPGAEVYSAATTRDQAKIVWLDAKRMAEKTAGLRQRFGVATMAHAINVEGDASTFKALSAEGDTLDGLNVHGGLIDELHAHRTREVFDVVNSGTGSRQQPVIWLITTAGFNRSGVCYEQRTYLTKVLEGIHQDESYFGIIFTIDEGDDWTARESWIKANPNFGVSVQEKDIATLCRQAMLSAQSQNNFLTKRLNVWVNADVSWMNMQAWDACKDPALTLDDFEGEPCIMALDLASKVDIAAKVLLFQRDGLYYGFGTYYLPEDAVEAGVNTNAAHYAGWANEGRLTTTDGAIIDQDVIKDHILEDCRRFQMQHVAYDPFQATKLATELMAEAVPMVEYGAQVRNFSDPMKELEAIVLDRRLRHDGDPVLAWMVSNVVCHTDAKDNVFPRKERPENKIDGAVALIMALGMALRQQKPVTANAYVL